MPTTMAAVLGLAFLFAGWMLMFLLPGTRAVAWGILALGAALVAGAAILDFRRVRGALASQRGRFGVATTVRVALFAGIILLANAISVGVFHRFDFTGVAQFTLTSQTKGVLAKLDSQIEIVSFFAPATPLAVSDYARSLLAEYQSYTDRLSTREVDPDLQPDQARKYGVDQLGAAYGVVVVRGPAGQRQVSGPQIAQEAEHALTSAILEVTGTKQRKVYFLTGHGERGIHADYDAARQGLRDNLFQVDELDLAATPAVPADAAVLVVAGPRKSPTAGEMTIMREYLEHEGRLFLLLDPDPPPEFRQLLSRWRMDIQDGIIVDPVSYVAPNKDNIMVPRTRNSFLLAETYFPGATAVIPQSDVADNLKPSALVWTSQEAWLDKDFAQGREPQWNGQVEKKGPLAIGAFVSTGTDRGAHLVVLGDSDFASNRHFHNGDNGDLFATAVNWLAAGTEVLSIDRKVLAVRRLLISPEQERFLQVSSIGLLPLLLLLAGGYVWWRRR